MLDCLKVKRTVWFKKGAKENPGVRQKQHCSWALRNKNERHEYTSTNVLLKKVKNMSDREISIMHLLLRHSSSPGDLAARGKEENNSE